MSSMPDIFFIYFTTDWRMSRITVLMTVDSKCPTLIMGGAGTEGLNSNFATSTISAIDSMAYNQIGMIKWHMFELGNEIETFIMMDESPNGVRQVLAQLPCGHTDIFLPSVSIHSSSATPSPVVRRAVSFRKS